MHLVDAEEHVVEGGHPGQQAGRLEHDAAVGARAVDLLAGDRHAARRGLDAGPATIDSTVDLPQPEWPMRRHELALGEREVEVAHDDRLARRARDRSC